MKKTSKKMMSLLIMVALIISTLPLSGFTSTKVADEKLKIGVIVYSTTDPQQLAINKYYKDYLGPQFGVDFIFSEALTDANSEIAFIENCAAAGAKGIIAFYQINQNAALEKCKQLKIYYTSTTADKKIVEAQKANPYFLGGVVQTEADYDSAYQMATYFLKNGSKSIGMPTGLPKFVDMFRNRRQGVVDAIAAYEKAHSGVKIKLNEFEGFPGEDGVFFANQASLLSKKPDTIIANFSGDVFWIQPIANAGKTGKIKLGTYGTFSKATQNAFYKSQIQYMVGIYPEMRGPSFALLYNAITGYADQFRDNGSPLVVNQSNINVSSSMEMNMLMVAVNGKVPPYSVADLKSVCKKFNPKATVKDFINLAKANKINDILARRNAKK